MTGSGTVAAAGPTAAFDRYWTALATGDAAAAVDVACRERADGVPLLDVLEGLVSAGQHEVGRRWAANEWGVAAEHRATSVSEEVVAALTAQLGRPAVEAGTVVVTCADGEWHSLPSRILSAVLREAGWSVTFLGASVPARHLTQLLHDLGPDLTALSCMIPTGLFQARQVVEVSRSMGVPVLVGGRGFGVDGSRGLRIGADAWAPDARTAVELLRSGSLPRFTDPAPPLVEPDLDSLRLRAARSELVAASMAAVSNRMRDVAGYDDHQRARTEEDLGFIVDFLRAALFVDDPALFVDFVGWLVEILTPRSVPPGTVRGGLAVLSGVIADRVGPLPRAQRILHAGLDSIV